MIIGKILDLQNVGSAYMTVRDEHNQDYLVHISEVPADLEVGDELPYYVDLLQTTSGRMATLRYDYFEE